MKRKVQYLTIILFLIFIFGLAIGNVFIADKSFSANENRYLASMPEISLDNIFNNDFDEEFDTYFNDQFIFRDQWIMLKSLYQQVTLNIANNEVYYAKDQNLISQELSYNEALVENNIKYINNFVSQYHKVNFMLIPTAALINKNLLPMFSYNYDQLAVINQAYSNIEANNINLVDSLLKEDDIYFKTDHHWNEKGARIGYEAICDHVLNKEPNNFNYQLVADDFKGTLLSRAGTFWYEGDNIYHIEPENSIQVEMQIDQDEKTYDSIYVDEALDTKDKYTYYEGGNHAYVKINTSLNNGKKAFIIKDSYAHILIPYLISEYEEIEMIDLRYFRQDLKEMIEENDDIYIIYSVDSFITDTNFVFLN